MTNKEIRNMIDDERAERLTAQLCRHWEVATQRLEGLAQELAEGMDTCVEAEVYAAIMRMQSAVMALTELNKMPCAFLFSEYLDRAKQKVSDVRMRQAVMMLISQLMSERPDKPRKSFLDFVSESLTQHFALPQEEQKAIQQKASPMKHILSICAQHLKADDLMMVASMIQALNADNDAMDQEETASFINDIRQSMDGLLAKMSESLEQMIIELALLMLLPEMIVGVMQEKRTNSQMMAKIFNMVLVRVRESNKWWNYWKEQRETLRVVNDSLSKSDIMNAASGKEREVLGQYPGGLFAKWAADREAFDAEFLNAHLSDDELRGFIFHLATLLELKRELNPTTKFGEEQLVKDEQQQVGDAVMEAADKLKDLTDGVWFKYYDQMWQELIQNEEIFAHLKVTRKSPHNNLFTARFFCHLVGEMKKRAVFGAHSDRDLAKRLVDKNYEDTYRKNIQEGMGDEEENIRNIFNAIYQKYNDLVHPKK